MSAMNDTVVKKELRLCKVGNELGYFHCWEQYSNVVQPGFTIGSHEGGQYSRVFGIVEFPNLVMRVDPTNIQFVDEEHKVLEDMNQFGKDPANKEN